MRVYVFLINIILFFAIIARAAPATPLRIAGLEMIPHVVYNKDQKAPNGVAPTFIKKYVAPELLKKHGLTLDWYQAPPARIIADLQAGNLDVVIFLIKSYDRQKLFNFGGKPFISENAAMIVNRSFTKKSALTNYRPFKNKTITMMSGTYIPDFMKENNIAVVNVGGYEITETDLNLLDARKIDGIFLHLFSIAQTTVQRYGFQKKLKVVKLPMRTEGYVVFSKALDPKIQKAVDDVFTKHQKKYPQVLR